MSDMIYYKNGDETFHISPPTGGTKTPKTKLEVKKMTEIEKTKQEIKMLQDKLNKLEEAEKEPDMMLMRQGKVDIVDYNTKVYYRIEYTDSFSGAYVWFLRRRGEKSIRQVRDINVYGVLEDYYQKQVLKQKEDYPYKKQTPEEVAEGLRNAMKQAKEDGVFDEPTKPMDEVVDRLENKYKDAEENTASYITDDVVNRMLKEWEENPPDFLKFELGKTLEEIICKCMVDYNSTIPVGLLEDILNNIEEWLPDFQSHKGTQSSSGWCCAQNRYHMCRFRSFTRNLRQGAE